MLKGKRKVFRGKAALLMGGVSPEREVSLMSGAEIRKALTSLRVDFVAFDPARRPLSALRRAGVSRAFNILHGGAGEDGTIPAALGMMGISCTGSGMAGSALAMDKFRAKLVWRGMGIPTPPGGVARNLREARAAYREFGPSVFVKPVDGGSSIDVSPVEKAGGMGAAVERIFRRGGVALVEKRVRGDEMNLGILENAALPLVRVEAAGEFYDYEAKYFSDETRYFCPCGIGAAKERELARVGTAAFRALGCAGWGRVEFILDARGRPHFLEVNTVPGMTSHSLVPMAAKRRGIGFDDLVRRILEDGE